MKTVPMGAQVGEAAWKAVGRTRSFECSKERRRGLPRWPGEVVGERFCFKATF